MKMSKRLAILDMPSARLIMMSLLNAATSIPKSSSGLCSFRTKPYALLSELSRAHRVLGGSFQHLENTGRRSHSIFLDFDMSKL